MKANYWLVLCCCILLLSACGWQLQGAQAGNKQLGSVYVTGDNFNGVITKTVRTDLRNGGISIASRRTNADVILWIGTEESLLRTASYDVLVRAAENTLIMQINYEMRAANGEIIAGPNTVYAERVYEYDVQGVTSSAAQLSIITRELQQRLAQQIVRRVNAVDPQASTREQATDAGPGP